MSVRIKDVAKAAGVSTATVSRVISGKPGVGAKTTERVKKIIDELGYRPNISARGLARQQTGNIGIVSPRTGHIVFGNPFFTSIFEGVSTVLDKKQFNMVFTFTFSQQKRLLENYSVDGILLFAIREDDSIVQSLKGTNIPTVVVGSYRGEDYPSVRPDDKGGIYEAVKYLVEKGHTRIGLVNGPLTSNKSALCQQGYEEAMHDLVPGQETKMIEVDEYDSKASYTYVKEYLKSNKRNRLTAFVCASDYLAIGVIKAAQMNQLNIPEDLSVIGFGDVPIFEFSNPPLTTMHTNLVKIGKTAANMLISKIEGRQIRKKTRTFTMELVERQSVRNLKE